MYLNNKLYRKCKVELSSDKARKILPLYKKECGLKRYHGNYLSYYTPILAVLRQYFRNLRNKNILEVGYRLPAFLGYLKLKGANVYGIDVKPYIVDREFFKMSIEKIEPKFKKHFSNYFHAIVERLVLSRQYDEEYFLKTGKHRFHNRKLILSNIYQLLRPNGILVLQDDRGTIFTESDFVGIGLKKVLKDIPVVFRWSRKKCIWNTLGVYKKSISKKR